MSLHLDLRADRSFLQGTAKAKSGISSWFGGK